MCSEPELAGKPAAFHCSASPTDRGKEALDMDQSAPTGFISTAPMTCSTNCLPQLAMAVPVLDAPSSATLTEDSLKTNNIHVAAVPLTTTDKFSAVLASKAYTPMVQMQQLYNDSEFFRPTSSQSITIKVPVHRPMPWPSFMCVHADGDEARPLPWPSFREIGGCEFPKDDTEKASQQCLSGSSDAKMSSVVEFQISGLCGKHFISAGCTTIHDMCSAGELRHWNDVLLLIGYGSAYLPSVHSVHTALAWLSCPISATSLELKLTSVGSWLLVDCSVAVCQKSHSSQLIVVKEWCLDSQGVQHVSSFLDADVVSGSSATGYFVWISEQEKKISDVVVVKEYYGPNLISEHQPEVTGIEHMSMGVDVLDGRVDITKGNSAGCFSGVFINTKLLQQSDDVHLQLWLLHIFFLEDGLLFSAAPSIWAFNDAPSMSIILTDWFLHNHMILATVQVLNPIKYQLLADKWRTQILGVRLVHLVFLAVVWPEHHCIKILQIGQLLGDPWKLTSPNACWSAISFHAQGLQGAHFSAQLQWAALLIEVVGMFSAGLSMQQDVASSVQTTVQYTHTYQLSILAPNMFSSAWGNADCMSIQGTTRCALQVTSSELLVFMVALGSRQGTFQGGRQQTGLNRHRVLRLLWDPGGVAAAAWGQAAFQGGRGVRNPSCTSPWAGTWAIVMGLTLRQSPVGREQNYKYARRCNGYGIQKDHGDEPALSSPSPSSISHPLSL